MPIGATALASWRMAIVAISAMPLLVIITLTVTTVLSLLADPEAPLIIDVAVAGVDTLVRLPLELAIYRFALLREKPPLLGVALAGQPLWRFAGYMMAFNLPLILIFEAPMTILDHETAQLAAKSILVAAVIFIAVRATIILPAIAVDAPQPTFSNALRDTKGHFLKIFATGLLILLPIMAILVILIALTGDSPNFESGAVGTVILAAVSGLLFLGSATLTAYIYAALADRLGRPHSVVLVTPP